MRKLAIGFVVGVAGAFAVWGAAFALALGVPTESSRWCHEMIQKKTAFALAQTRPKLILVGGSASLFGLQAQRLQTELGMPVVNFGTHAALTPAYMFRTVRPVARPGDTILLLLEYELYVKGRLEKDTVDLFYLDYILARDPAYLRERSFAEQITFAMYVPERRLKRGISNRIRPERKRDKVIYNIANLNANGDQLNHRAQDRIPGTTQFDKLSLVLMNGFSGEPSAWPDIAEFCRWAQANNIRVLAALPPVLERPEYVAVESIGRELQRLYASVNVPMIGKTNLTERLLPQECFYDTIYHLTQEQAEIETMSLVRHLKQQILAAGVTSSR